MTDKSKEEKRRMFFDMQEHPEHYTDEQLEQLLADEEIKSFFHDLAMARMAGRKAYPQEVDVDEAWERFSKSHGVSHGRRRMKIAASIIGVVFVSGVAWATAVHNGWIGTSASEEPEVSPSTMQVAASATLDRDSLKVSTQEKKDSTDLKPVVFDNAELGDILSQISAFYQVKVEYANTDTRHIRLFFNWDKTKTLEQNLMILNAFERIQITCKDGVLNVE